MARKEDFVLPPFNLYRWRRMELSNFSHPRILCLPRLTRDRKEEGRGIKAPEGIQGVIGSGPATKLLSG